MQVPVAALRALLPLGSSLGTAVALSALYGLLSLVAYAFFAVWAYLPYLDSGLGAGGAPACTLVWRCSIHECRCCCCCRCPRLQPPAN